MNIDQLDFVVAVIGMIALAAFWVLLWVPTMVSSFRQGLFDLRDKLFDDVAEGALPVSFTSQSYMNTRERLNLMIRFSHDVRIIRTLIVALFTWKESRELALEIQAEEQSWPEVEREAMEKVEEKKRSLLIDLVVGTSPVFWAGILILAVLLPLILLADLLHKKTVAISGVFGELLFCPVVHSVEYQSSRCSQKHAAA